MRLVIRRPVYEGMIEHCYQGLPNEACGFLAGRDGTAERLYPLTNEAASPVFYRPAGREMLEAMNDMDAQDLEPLVIFHSHVASAPYPSPTDVGNAHYPDSIYVIVSLADRDKPEVRGYLIHKESWRSESGDVEEVDLVVW